MPFSDRRDLENFGLEPFEVAQLGNLCPGDAQEAKALIPSLAMPDRDIDNTRLTELLEQLNSFKQYG
jgi:DNA-directed RNA polymerase II subunit RPB4